ncbi:hypothetical protein ACHAQJ_010505 [Trichoderma viride]
MGDFLFSEEVFSLNDDRNVDDYAYISFEDQLSWLTARSILAHPNYGTDEEAECDCPAEFQLNAFDLYCTLMDITNNATKFGLYRLCDKHLRVLSEKYAGLKTGCLYSATPTQGLQCPTRAFWYSSPKSRLVCSGVGRAGTTNWGRGRLYVYFSLPPKGGRRIYFDDTKIYKPFAGSNTYSVTASNLAQSVSNVYEYLNGQRIQEMIESEFALYHHHEVSKSQGDSFTMRNMYFSLNQQLVRQDPISYALGVCYSTEKSWRLITIPDIALDTRNMTHGLKTLEADRFSEFAFRNGGRRVVRSVAKF